MAEFEGKMSLNADASEVEVNGKFKLSEKELNAVSGGERGGAVAPASPCDSCSLFEPKDANDPRRNRFNCSTLLSDTTGACAFNTSYAPVIDDPSSAFGEMAPMALALAR